jgi:hypothetical protein
MSRSRKRWGIFAVGCSGGFDLQHESAIISRGCILTLVLSKEATPGSFFEYRTLERGLWWCSTQFTSNHAAVLCRYHPHASTDLESYHSQGKMVWREACQVLWQVVKALKVAEKAASFEVCKQHSVSRNDLIAFCLSIVICTGVRSICKRISSQQPKRTRLLQSCP